VLVDWDKKQIDWVMESGRQLSAEEVTLDVEELLTWDVVRERERAGDTDSSEDERVKSNKRD